MVNRALKGRLNVRPSNNRCLMIVLKDEMEMNMRLIGARTIADLDESMVDTRAISTHIGTPIFIRMLRNSSRSE
jgi:hypothetical protein